MPTPFESATLNLRLAELRAASGTPEFCRHLEQVVLSLPGAEAILESRRAQLRAFRARRAATAPDGA